MTKEEVLKAIINLFKKINAVDPNFTQTELKKVKMNDLAWFQMDFGLDDDLKKEILFKMLEACITNLNNGVQPVIEPADFTLFNYPQTIEETADMISTYS